MKHANTTIFATTILIAFGTIAVLAEKNAGHYKETAREERQEKARALKAETDEIHAHALEADRQGKINTEREWKAKQLETPAGRELQRLEDADRAAMKTK